MASYEFTGITFEILSSDKIKDMFGFHMLAHLMPSTAPMVNDIQSKYEGFNSDDADVYVEDEEYQLINRRSPLIKFFEQHPYIGFISDGTLPDKTPEEYTVPCIIEHENHYSIYIPLVSKRNNELFITNVKRLIDYVFGYDRLICTDVIYATEEIVFSQATFKRDINQPKYKTHL